LTKLAADKRVTKLSRNQGALWIAAERLPEANAIWPSAPLSPEIAPPTAYAKDWAREEALVEVLRGRLQALGPVALGAIADSFALPQDEIALALTALEAEGFAMRGRFTPAAQSEEWCERRLLARIHTYTVKRLRAEIEPVAPRDFLRFLFSWQHAAPDTRLEGQGALENALAQLEGYEAPAKAWEGEILPARLTGYKPSWLDELCLAGRIAWARLQPLNGAQSAESRPAPVRTTPVTFLARRHTALWTSLSPESSAANVSSRANTVLTCIREQGALFFDEIVDHTNLLRTHVEEALGELVALGLLTSDSFGGLRGLLVSARDRNMASRNAKKGIESAGRWALARRTQATRDNGEAVEHVARTLLKRYGVVFWRLLAREAEWLPPWRDLLRVYRKLESRGEIRGGRFVAGFSGEQFALPDAVGALRSVRRREAQGELVSISGADPLNLAGIVTPGPKLPALTGNRVLYRDGIPIAFFAGGEVEFLEPLSAEDEWQAQKLLLRSALAGPVKPPRRMQAPAAPRGKSSEADVVL
jgi:ATP-dependent Lhr-like helicase